MLGFLFSKVCSITISVKETNTSLVKKLTWRVTKIARPSDTCQLCITKETIVSMSGWVFFVLEYTCVFPLVQLLCIFKTSCQFYCGTRKWFVDLKFVWKNCMNTFSEDLHFGWHLSKCMLTNIMFVIPQYQYLLNDKVVKSAFM